MSIRFLWLLCFAPVLGPHAADTLAERMPLAWSDTPVARIEALAVLEALNSELLSHDSATLTPEDWCRQHRLADPVHIRAERVQERAPPLSAERRAVLQVSPSEPIRYRHVRLFCGHHQLSEAQNWYVPARLTPAINRLLDSTDTPFGRAAHSLKFQRRTVEVALLWRPLPSGWEMNGAPATRSTAHPLQVPHELLRHRALLVLNDGTPIAQVIETYTADVLAFPQPVIAAPLSVPDTQAAPR
jgi:hypothetical protein